MKNKNKTVNNIKDLPVDPTHIAPDGSQIRELPECEKGGLSQCILPANAKSTAVKHKTVDEVWYVVSGKGELSLDSERINLIPGRGILIEAGSPFQFRNLSDEPLEIMISTMPKWPGPDEAILLEADLFDL